MKVLDRLPYGTGNATVAFQGEAVRVKPHQIVVWVSVTVADLLEWDPKTPALPAILDTGNNFTFTIHQSRLIRWAGIRPELLRVLGRIKHNEHRIPRYEADLWLHPNVAGTRDRRPDRKPFRLELPQGIAIHADEPGIVAPLPLLGLRALTGSRLHTMIDAEHREVSVHTPHWLSRLFRALRLPPY